MKRLLLTSTFVAGMFALSSLSAFAILIDDMDNTDNFTSGFGGVSASANGDGTVTLQRSIANVDAGIDWRPDGTFFFDISSEPLLSVTPTSPENGGFYSTSILFFDGSDSFISEQAWIGDTNSVAVQSLDVENWVSTPVGAEQYFLRFRILPFTSTDGGFTFTQMAAVPEPTVASFLLAGGLLTLMRRRHRKSF